MIRSFDYMDVLYLVYAARWTLLLTLFAFAGAAVVGFVVAVLRMMPYAPLRWVALLYTHLVQGVPLLVWLFLLYFGVGAFGFDFSPWTAAAMAFSIYGGAFLGEVWRGALTSVPQTQWEAGASLGLSFAQQLRYTIIPQAVRIALPPTMGFLVQLTKNTSLAAVIGIVELTREGQLTSAATFRPFTVYLVISAIYFSMCFPLTQWSRSLERKMNGYS